MNGLDATSVNRTLGQIDSHINALGDAVRMVGGQVSAVGAETAMTRTELSQLRTDFERFVLEAGRTANVQRAETKVGALQGQVEHEFGHYKVVRRSAVGILQQFDTGLVSEETVRNIGEQLMVQTPRYWLAPVLVALASWVGDDRYLCERAVEEAFRRSPTKSPLFFALVLRRQGREEAAVRWLRHYLNGLDPTTLGRDFAVILEAISQGAFGPAGRELASQSLDRWRVLLAADDEVNDAQVKRWRVECEEHAGPVTPESFPRLAKTCPQWPALQQALSGAETHRALQDKYGALMAEEKPVTMRLEDAVDDILDRLVSEYDNEELPLRRELAFQQAVIDNVGDLDRAQATADAGAAVFEETLDYLTIQTTSSLQPDQIGVSRATQRMAVAACHEWFGRAHQEFTLGYRSALPTDVEAQLDYQHTIASRIFQLPQWKGSFETPLEDLERDLAAHWDRHTKAYIAGFAYDWRRKAILPAVIVALLFIVLVGASAGVAFFLAAVVGGIWAAVIYSRYDSARKAQKQAAQLIAQAKQESIAELRGAGAELTDWASRYRAADGEEPRTRQLIASIATAAHGGSHYDGRLVG